MSEGKSGGKKCLQGSSTKKIPGQRTTFQDKAKHRKLHNQPRSWPLPKQCNKGQKDDTRIDRQRPGVFRTTHAKYLFS